MWAVILGFITTILVPLIISALKYFGIGAVTYVGFNSLLQQAKGYLVAELHGLPADIISILYLARIDEAISILFSAAAVRLALNGVDKASDSKTAWKAPQPPLQGGA